jgi:hypothetical protein
LIRPENKTTRIFIFKSDTFAQQSTVTNISTVNSKLAFQHLCHPSMSIFGKIAGAVTNTIEISTLDDIVGNLLRICDKRLEEISNDPQIGEITTEEAKAYEDRIFLQVLGDYDSKAIRAIGGGKSIATTWNEGGGGNLEVRKRILNRGLEAKRGVLLSSLLQRIRADPIINAQKAIQVARTNLDGFRTEIKVQ